MTTPLNTQVIRDFQQVLDTWNQLTQSFAVPFHKPSWMSALWNAGCVGAPVDWEPVLFILRQNKQPICWCLAYIKHQSQGEFFFDHEWAHAANRLGHSYYPKLIFALPFTPATAPKLFFTSSHENSQDQAHWAETILLTIKQFALEQKIFTVQSLFVDSREAKYWSKAGFLEREDWQFHWSNKSYQNFEDYLAQLNSKRRAQIKREIREVQQAGCEFRFLCGDEITLGHLKFMYELHVSHLKRMGNPMRYLNEQFFLKLGEQFKENICLVQVKQNGEWIAGCFNVFDENTLFGRYWGSILEVRNLHFVSCYYQGIEFCIQRKLKVFQPGAGGEYKLLRGFVPTKTTAYYFFNNTHFSNLVGNYLEREREAYQQAREQLSEHAQFKKSALTISSN